MLSVTNISLETIHLDDHAATTPHLESNDSDRAGLVALHHRNWANAAIRKTRALPFLQWLLHGASIAFTVAILVLCGRNVYFADLTRPNINSILNALMFVARFHEIIVSASLASMLLYHLRYELCASKGLPLFYLATPFQLSMPHMLFEPEFWSALTAKDKNRRKYWFCASVLVATALTALIGPSSAILILPQLDWWVVKHPFAGTNGFTYLNASYDTLWPSHIDSSSVPLECVSDLFNPRVPQYCPYANVFELSRWAQDYLSQWAPPNVTATSDANMLRYLTSSHLYKNVHGYSVTSTGMSHLSRDLGTAWLYAQRHNLSFTGPGRPMLKLYSRNDRRPIMRPLVQVQCSMPYDITTEEFITISFPSDKLKRPGQVANKQNITQTINTKLFENHGFPKVKFTNLSAEAGRPTLGALVGMSFVNPQSLFGSSFNGSLARGLIPCTIASHWIPTTMAHDPSTDNFVILDNPDPMSVINSTDLMGKARNIDINLSYAEAVNIDIFPGTDILPRTNVLEYELSYLAFSVIQPPGFCVYDGEWKNSWAWLVSTLLSLQLSDGLARHQHAVPMYVYCHDCRQGSYAYNIDDLNNPQSLRVWPNSSSITLPQSITAHPELYTPIQWRVEHFGYAWSLDRVTKFLAATVVILHSLLVIAHLFLVCMRRWRCDSWNSLVDLIALAVQSPPTAILRGTSTGIDDASTYANTVLIRESAVLADSGGDHSAVLVITDPADRHQYQSRKLRSGKKYL